MTVAAVPTGMKAGVRISPRRIWIAPVRALPSVAAMEKEKRGFVTRRALGSNAVQHKCAERRPSPKAADTVEQQHRVNLEPFDPAIAADERQAIGRQTQHPRLSIGVLQCQRRLAAGRFDRRHTLVWYLIKVKKFLPDMIYRGR
ncbi:hypothetical protein [uncultured Brevundimonas sp.]|uniref:hypothetical protein n=1 Tax=uncultured Brevundimonas sp. TaxID=213418 RepID=UPI0025EB39D5|nr:hypothetical protein [uncultured Brevundimonas sp.]